MDILKVVVEVRPRLGSANAYIPGGKGLIGGVQLVGGNEIRCVSFDEKNLAAFEWPAKKFGKLLTANKFAFACGDDISFRLSLPLSSSATNFGLVSEKLSRIKLAIPSLRKLAEPGQVDFLCAGCGHKLCENAKLRRILPMPSAGWRVNSPDWFCACFSACQHVENHENDGKLTNKNMAENSFGPSAGDIIYSHGFFAVNADIFEDKTNCPGCDRVAFCREKGDERVAKIWHHQVSIVDHGEMCDKPQKPGETFSLILSYLARDNNWQPLKILLKSGANNLLVWTVEPRLTLLTLAKNGRTCDETLVMKVLAKNNVDSGEKCDHEIDVPDEVVAGGREHLKLNQYLIPSSQRQDGSYLISYVDIPLLSQCE